MKLVLKTFLIIFFIGFFAPQDSYARLFAPGGEDAIGTNPEPQIRDINNDGDMTDEDEYYDYNQNNVWDADTSPNISNMTYSSTWDASFPNVVCLYDRTQNPPELIINKFFITDSSKILFGIDNPGACPLPGRKIFMSYPNSVAGEFLISGVICVVNTIIFDAMFKVYCAIILWFYNILYSMIIIYVMFYGLSIMLGIGNDLIREAPKRVFKIVLIFFFAVNAQFGFRFIHNGFISALNGFTDMLTEIQPYHSEQGQPAYKKSFLSNLAASLTLNILEGPGKLLDEAGNVWKPIAGTQTYYYFDINSGEYKPDSLPQGANTGIGTVEKENYQPFRNPAQQWSYQKTTITAGGGGGGGGCGYDYCGGGGGGGGGSPTTKQEYRILPVFKELPIGKEDMDVGKIACIIDVRLVQSLTPNPNQPDIKIQNALVEYPRCNRNLLPSLAQIAPFGLAGIYVLKDNKLYRESIIRGITVSTAPQRLKDTKDNLTETCETLDLVGAAINLPKTCRKPFQGILGKVDSIFNATVGNDSSKSLGALAGAILLWGSGAGILLSLLLMTGIVTLFVAFFQLVWTYVTAIMALTFLLMLSPIFVSCALFKITDKFFQGWLSALISYTMQPFLIMAFLFIISNMTNLNKLEEIGKNVGKKQQVADIGGTGSVIRSLTPAFMGPLYTKPYDFDTNYYSPGGGSSGEKNLINAAQREKYIRSKGEKILDCWLIAKSGVPCTDLYLKNNQSAALEWPSAAFYKALWNSGTGIEPGTGTEIKTGRSGGILAIVAYAANNAEAQEFLTCYKEGCTISGSDIPGLAGKRKPGQGIDWDDGDSFLGEPGTADTTGASNFITEYPVCEKFCPEFKPAYDLKKPETTNPLINVPTLTKYPDGSSCPTDDQGNVTMCAPNAECTGNCMEIKSALEFNYGTLAGAILMWILLNAVTVAFVAKIPALAEALSKWSSYAPSGMPLGGASRSWDEEGMDAWTQQEKSGFFHMGGLFDTGIVSGRPSGLPLLLSAVGRVGQGGIKYVDQDGSIKTRSRGFRADKPFGGEKGEKLEKNKATIIGRLKAELGIAEESPMNSRSKKVEAQGTGGLNNVFQLLRPDLKTGLPHAELLRVIQEVLGDPAALNAFNSGDYGSIKYQIAQKLKNILPAEDTKPKPGQ